MFFNKYPVPLYDEDPANGDGGQLESDDDSQDDSKDQKWEKLLGMVESQNKKLDTFERLVGKWSTEVGATRQDLASVKTFMENFQNKTSGDNEFDPYDRDKLQTFIQESLKPIAEFQKNYVTVDSLQQLLAEAERLGTVKEEFSLTDDEMRELNAKAQEAKTDLRLMAFETFGERKFKAQKKGLDLKKELKTKDTTEPMQPGADSVFTKIGIPTDPKEIEKLVKEKGLEYVKNLMVSAKPV